MRLLDQLIEEWKYRRRRRPDLNLVQRGYHSSSSWGSEYMVLVRNDGGSIARDVEVALILDGDQLDAKTVSVEKEGEEPVKLRVPIERCAEAVPNYGYRALGKFSFEARLDGKVAAAIDGETGIQ